MYVRSNHSFLPNFSSSRENQMAYAAVTSLMETLSLHFLQSQPPFPLEDLDAQIRYGNQNLGLLQQILEIGNDGEDAEAEMREMGLDGASSSSDYYPKKKTKSEKLQQLADLEAQIRKDKYEKHGLLHQIVEAQMREMELDEEASSKRINACFPRLDWDWDSILLTSRLREMAELKQNIVSLHQNLGLLQQSLEKSEFPYDDERVRVMKDLEAQIRDASFKAEERIEMELSAIYLAKDSLLHKTACLLRLHQILIEAQKQTDYHRNELIRIQRRGLLQLVKGLLHKKTIVSNFSQNTSKFESKMVGCDKVFLTVLDQLKQQSTKGRQVVSIVGMGGIGKTTLAEKVYNDPLITSYFDKRAWATVSQEYNVEQMLRCLLSCVTAASSDGQHQLAESLCKHLRGQRYLIVIDDIWSITAWDCVQRCFPDDNNGSRILLTSRLKEVAEYASSGNTPLNMPFLDANESWNLYCKVFGKTEFLLVFEQIGRYIVNKCEGLPLAIIVVASLLSKIKEEEEEWKNVAKNVIGDSNDACSRILYLSYHQLPHHLKACFLYFGVFPEDYEISVKKLVRLWAAEGFLRAVKHVNMEKVAMECLQNLVDRSLVIVSEESYNGKMKTIRIHDLLRDLCLKEGGRENLLNVNGDEKLPFYQRKSQHQFSKPCRWISDTSECLNNQIRSGDKRFDKSHSLHSRFHYSSGFYFHVLDELLSHLKLLRVLDIECGHCSSTCEVNVFAILVHLRYFALTFPTTEDHASLYVKFFEHRNMQSFIVRGRYVKWNSSSAFTIWAMPLLRNFCVEKIVSLGTSSIVHRNLENISWLHSKLCTQDLFTRIPNLKELGIKGRGPESSDCFYNLMHLRQLEALSIRWYCLEHIPCSGIPWATSFLPNLKKLRLFGTSLPWSDMRLIGMLRNLEVLKLITACKGPKWETSEGGFRQLKRLVIEDKRLEDWNAEGDHFPMLECLELHKCTYLQEIPSGFVDITTLSLIEVNYCPDSLLTSAKWIKDEQFNNYGNSILVRKY